MNFNFECFNFECFNRVSVYKETNFDERGRRTPGIDLAVKGKKESSLVISMVTFLFHIFWYKIENFKNQYYLIFVPVLKTGVAENKV